MELNKGEDQLVKELRTGEAIAKQVKDQLASSNPSHQALDSLIQQLIASYDRNLQSLQIVHHTPPTPPLSKSTISSSVRVSSGSVDDAFSWRKYGQKNILGFHHPRSYYRCTHRHSRGCLARKHVQKSNHHPPTFEITYHRTHTCNSGITTQQTSHVEASTQSAPDPAELIMLRSDQEFQTDRRDSDRAEDMFLCFPLTGSEDGQVSETFGFDSEMLGLAQNGEISSESDPLTQHIISTPTSIYSSPVWDSDFMIDAVQFDNSFSLENLEFFSW